MNMEIFGFMFANIIWNFLPAGSHSRIFQDRIYRLNTVAIIMSRDLQPKTGHHKNSRNLGPSKIDASGTDSNRYWIHFTKSDQLNLDQISSKTLEPRPKSGIVQRPTKILGRRSVTDRSLGLVVCGLLIMGIRRSKTNEGVWYGHVIEFFQPWSWNFWVFVGLISKWKKP